MQKLGINEAYMPVDDYSNYEVSNYGRVRNRKTGRILKSKLNNYGYECVTLFDGMSKAKHFTIHRLVLLAFEGSSKDLNQKCVDHVDNNRTNNCLFNLRWVSPQQNQFNSSMRKDNTSGIRGVYYNKQHKKWQVRIRVDGKLLFLGYFNKIEDAKIARRTKAKEVFGQYLNVCEV
jgi:hypothetical protein